MSVCLPATKLNVVLELRAPRKMNLKLLLLIIPVTYLAHVSAAQGQVVEDQSLGTQVRTENNRDFRVDGGELRGGNLFHSFEQFSVPDGGSVFLNNAASIDNIIGRVTGTAISEINGLIQNNGAANLFLINPNGIVFGANATLDIGGSFVGTTAESLIFEDGTEFSSNLAQDSALLTVNLPLGLQFGSSSGEIINQASRLIADPLDQTGQNLVRSGLATRSDRTLALLGNGITFDGGVANSGNLELGSVAPNSFVGLESIAQGWRANYNDVNQFQNIEFTNLALADASGAGGGNINIVGNNIRLLAGSAIISNTLGNLDGGTIQIKATDLLQIDGSDSSNTEVDDLAANFTEIFLPAASRISSRTVGTGNGSNINIVADELQISDGGAIELQTFSTIAGNGGDLAIDVNNSIELSGNRPLLGFSENAVNLIAPGIDLDTAIDLNQSSKITVISLGSGSAGNVNVMAANLSLEEGGLIGVSPFASGDGGNVDLNIAESLEITGISPRTGSVSSQITASTFADGDAGDINLTTDRLSLKDGGLLISTTASLGDSGNLTINAASVKISGISRANPTPSLISAQTDNGGAGGNILLNTDSLIVRDHASLSVSGSGSSIPGNLTVNAKTVEVRDSGIITATTQFEAGGNIELNVQDNLTLRNNGTISAQAFNAANGGNLEIAANFIVAFPQQNNDILANAVFGNGGNININAEGILGIEEGSSDPPNLSNDIDASSEFGEGGTVSLEFPDSSSNNTLFRSDSDFVDVAYLFANTFCKVRGNSKFVATGRSGIPLIPDDALLPEHTWSDWRIVEDVAETESGEELAEIAAPRAAAAPAKLAMIQGWMTDAQGNVILTDKPLTAAVRQPALNNPNCNDLQDRQSSKMSQK